MVELPQSCYFAWKWFTDLHNARSGNGFGINPINYTEMKAYFDLMGVTPQEWEVELIRKLDNQAMIAFAKEQNSKSKK